MEEVKQVEVPDGQAEVTPAQKIANSALKEMETTASFYSRPRVENEIDLVKEVRERLVALGAGDKLKEGFDENRFVIEAADKTAHAQQYNLNRYFNLQLSSVQKDTSVERYSLIYELRPDQWLKVIEKKILPAIIDNDLPAKI